LNIQKVDPLAGSAAQKSLPGVVRYCQLFVALQMAQYQRERGANGSQTSR